METEKIMETVRMVSEEKLLMEWFTYREEVHREFARRWCESMNFEVIE